MFGYNVFDDMINLRDVIDDFFRTVPVWQERSVDFPFVNVYERGDRLEVQALTPGVKADDLSIELINSNLVIDVDRKSDLAEVSYLRRERSFGRFRKTINLPYMVNRDSISADLSDGILTVRLEKVEEAKSKKITIK